MAEQNPFGLHTVTPYLVVDDVRSTMDFVRDVLGGELRGEPLLRDDGSIGHAEVTIGDRYGIVRNGCGNLWCLVTHVGVADRHE